MTNQINFETDSVIVVQFASPDSTRLQMLPANVSAAQMLVAAQILKLQAEERMKTEQVRHNMVEYVKQGIREYLEGTDKPPDILVAKGKVLKP